MKDFEFAKDVVLFVLAIYAAILSTINFIQSHRRDRRSLKVTMNTVMPTYGPNLGPPYAQLQAVNAGHRPVTVTVLTFQLPNGKWLMPMWRDVLPGTPDSDFPINLGQGDAARRTFSYKEVADGLLSNGLEGALKLRPVCQDSLGQLYHGKPMKVDPKEWQRMGRT